MMASSISGTPSPVLAEQRSISSRLQPNRSFGHGVVHVAFIEHRNDLQVVLDGHVEVGNRLRLYALRRIHYQYCTLARRNRTAHFITEIHMPRSVNEVERIALVGHLYSMTLDRDAALFLQLHVVEHLCLHLTHIYRPRQLQHAIGQRTFPVVYMRNYTKIPYLIHLSICVSMRSTLFIQTKSAAKVRKKNDIRKPACVFPYFFSFYSCLLLAVCIFFL